MFKHEITLVNGDKIEIDVENKIDLRENWIVIKYDGKNVFVNTKNILYIKVEEVF